MAAQADSSGGLPASKRLDENAGGGAIRNETPQSKGRRRSTDVASLRAGLFGALKDLRTQNQDLQTGISELSKGRTLPTPPKSKPVSRPSALLETTQKLTIAEAERDTWKSQVELLEKKIEDQQATIGVLRARGSSKETEIRDQIQELLKQRASELMKQVGQLEDENKVLIMASGDQIALIASLRRDVGKERERSASLALERNDARAAAKDASPGRKGGGASPEKLMAALEQSLDQRDHAIREKDASNAAREAMMTGFEDASAMMVEYTNELEAKLGVAQKQCHTVQVAYLELKGRAEAFENRVRVMESRGRDQDTLVGDLLEDLEKQRHVGGGTDEEKAKTIAFLRAKEHERKELAAAAVKFRKLSEASDAGGVGDARWGEDGEALATLLTLPEGWSEATSPEGLTYYVNHEGQTTTWVHPGVMVSDAEGSARGLPERSECTHVAPGTSGGGGAGNGGGGASIPSQPVKTTKKRSSILAKLTRKKGSSSKLPNP